MFALTLKRVSESPCLGLGLSGVPATAVNGEGRMEENSRVFGNGPFAAGAVSLQSCHRRSVLSHLTVALVTSFLRADGTFVRLH